MKVTSPPEATVDQANMTPFIDIIFQLLIFFMLTLRIKKDEGQILQQLPKDKGLAQAAAQIEPSEVRINICAHTSQRFDQHVGLKIRHQQMIDDLKKDGQPVGNICYAWIGDNYKDNTYSLYKISSNSDKKANNRSCYATLSDESIKIQALLQSQNKKAPIIIDSDGLVPYEHVFGFLSYLSSKGITNVELAGNPKFQKE